MSKYDEASALLNAQMYSLRRRALSEENNGNNWFTWIGNMKRKIAYQLKRIR